MALSPDIEKLIEQHTRFKPDDGKPGSLLPFFAWPGGYPIYYLDGDNCVLCPECAENAVREYYEDPEGVFENELPVAYDTNYEDPMLICEGCNERIESAYAEDDEEEEE